MMKQYKLLEEMPERNIVGRRWNIYPKDIKCSCGYVGKAAIAFYNFHVRDGFQIRCPKCNHYFGRLGVVHDEYTPANVPLVEDRCARCGLSAELVEAIGGWMETHHVVSRADGGQDDFDNTTRLCCWCHEIVTAQWWKERKIKEYYEKKAHSDGSGQKKRYEMKSNEIDNTPTPSESQENAENIFCAEPTK